MVRASLNVSSDCLSHAKFHAEEADKPKKNCTVAQDLFLREVAVPSDCGNVANHVVDLRLSFKFSHETL